GIFKANCAMTVAMDEDMMIVLTAIKSFLEDAIQVKRTCNLKALTISYLLFRFRIFQIIILQ
ncbi:MAG: hypothetical protein ACJARZ_001212, partial [Dokdonia sp.]